MESKNKYYKNSLTGHIICEQTFISDIITNIPTKYYDLHMREIGENFDLRGYVEIKQKKFDLYRSSRWNAGEINSWFIKPKIEKTLIEIRKEKLEELNKIKNKKYDWNV